MTAETSESGTERKRVELKFADEHQGDILSGEKSATVRLQEECPAIVPGTRLEIQDTDGDRFTTARVRTTVPLKLINAHHLVSTTHQYPNPGTLEEYIETMQGYYPDHAVTTESRVLVVFFEVSER